MTRLSSILTLAIISGAGAFMLPFSTSDQQRLLATADDIEFDDFDAPILKNPVKMADAPTVLDHEISVVDDECYLGKYGQYDECVDFDPMHEASVNTGKETTPTKASFEMPDFTAIGEEISAAFDKSPLGKLFSKK